ncbi:prepilin-type N-terminal cleavage/methylation domain-containing protein [Patescibacteria group bacterium]|nr:prepilin-type N-terminal cleavage/methylation domain-containing protein [Patescibacteria group bacterium]
MKKFVKLLKKEFSSCRGFTLIELLVVIAVIAILAVAILVAINPGQRIASARNARARSDLASLGAAATIFNVDTGLNPSCTGGASYPAGFPDATCGGNFPAAPSSYYTFEKSPATCGPGTVTPCTAVAIETVAYTDGTIVATLNVSDKWCWRSATGTVFQTNAAGCAP